MKNLYATLTTILCMSTITYAQNLVFSQNFEKLEKGRNIVSFKNMKFKTWGKSTWTVREKKGKGNKNSNMFVSSGPKENASLVKYHDLEVGESYVFSIAVKMTNANASWKTNYSVKALSGKKGNIHFYGKNDMKEPEANNWKTHKIEFTVIEGRENVCLQVYRWADGVTLSVDDFNLTKK